MAFKTKNYLKNLSLSIAFWLITMVAHIIIRYYGVYEAQGVHVKFDFNYSTFEYLNYGIIEGLTIGLLYSMVSFIIDNNKKLQKTSVWLNLLIQSIIYIQVIIIAISISSIIYDYVHQTNYATGLFWWINNKYFWSTALHAVLFSFGLSFLKISISRFGGKVFFKVLIGSYRTPKEEKLVLMLLDLKSSTTIAEKIGHFNYSKFIQECFSDLNQITEKYNVDIHQYVGDEAVITWTYNKGVRENNCLKIFFAFQEALLKKNTKYLEKYGFAPIFKAGIHGGQLMTTEVGTVKKQISYLGDVINATARIQSKCNEYNQQLIISETVLNDIDLDDNFVTEDLGELSLRGKSEQLKLLGIKNLPE